MKEIVGFIDFTPTQNTTATYETITKMHKTLRPPRPRIPHPIPAVTISRNYAYAGDSSNCLTELKQSLLLYRDPMGLTPLFYTQLGTRVIFASAIRAILAHPGVTAQLDKRGLTELLSLGPARYEHSGVFKDIHALPPGFTLTASKDGIKIERYWDFPTLPHEDSEEETIARVRSLLMRAVHSRIPSSGACALLSGGVDSSVVSAIAAESMREAGSRLCTFSFDFKDSVSHFQSNAFQPDLDRPWVDKMVEFCGSEHEYISCDSESLLDALYPAVEARDLPGMADVDASLLYFCEKIPKEFTIALTGECADEIFGGYPWFHTRLDETDTMFPWSSDFTARTALLKDKWADSLDLQAAASDYLNKSKSTDRGYLTLKWFMTTLLDRMYCMGWHSGLSGSVPFADVRLMEYVYSIPWEMKRKNGTVKHILREAARGIIPDEVLFRKKSPFPKTYDPAYTALLAERLHDTVADHAAPVLAIIDPEKARRFAAEMLKDPNTSRPWFGQLMAGPQLMAYVLQLDYWLRKYEVKMLF